MIKIGLGLDPHEDATERRRLRARSLRGDGTDNPCCEVAAAVPPQRCALPAPAPPDEGAIAAGVRLLLRAVGLAALLALPGCEVGPRRGLRVVDFAVSGDKRPSCTRGEFAPETPRLQQALARELLAHPDRIAVETGDVICAWPWEGQKAHDQLVRFQGFADAMPWDRVVFAEGNHEVAHAELLRASRLAATPRGWRDVGDVRFVWLPSDADVAHGLRRERADDRGFLASALSWDGRLVVVRHEPWGSPGTRGDGWIRDVVERARPNLILHGHVHTWAAPGQAVVDGAARLVLAHNQAIVGNGGAPGWAETVGWVGYTRVTLRADGVAELSGVDVDGAVRATASTRAP